MTKKISFTTHTDITALRNQWLQLDSVAEAAAMPYVGYTYYQTYEWNEFLYRLGREGLAGVTLRQYFELVELDGKPFAILPLSITRSSGKVRIPSFHVAGVLQMACPYTNIDDDTSTAIAQRILTQYQGMKLSFADAPCCGPFARVMAKLGGELVERESFHVPLMRFATHEEYVASLNKNIYKNIRKAYNHLKTDNRKMSLKAYSSSNPPSKECLNRIWHLYFRRKMAWRHKKMGRFSKLMIALRTWNEIHGGCATRSLQLSSSRLYVLEISGEAAAFMIVYEHRRHLLMPKLAIDTSFSRYSPGILLILEASKLWIDEGIVDFDMCRGDERYKKEMGGLNEPLCRVDVRS